MSKGSNPRPYSIPRDQFGAQFDAIMPAKPKHCPVCGYSWAWCACMPTDDGPGQENEGEAGK